MNWLAVLFRGLSTWVVLGLFWLREVVGWVLLVLGLLVFYECFVMLVSTPPRIIQVAPLTFVGFIVFRTGLHMLKVSAAALVCMRAQDRADESASASGAVRKPTAAKRTRVAPGLFEVGPRS